MMSTLRWGEEEPMPQRKSIQQPQRQRVAEDGMSPNEKQQLRNKGQSMAGLLNWEEGAENTFKERVSIAK